ncbi:MAG: DUF664 domain-containing protein [Thermomicrobiales bacterium]|nr:DUF664 domain-containing protein [Thermomicrobiales bacterium]
MTHPLVEQLRFTRGELRRALAGITDDEARTRLGAINSMSWIICHLAGQERRYWLIRAQGVTDLVPVLDEWGGHGKPASTPPLADAWEAYDAAIAAVDPYLDGLTAERLQEFIDGRQHVESIGTMLLRVIYHYWFHIGEAYAIRQMLGHTGLPEFVGDIGAGAPFRP